MCIESSAVGIQSVRFICGRMWKGEQRTKVKIYFYGLLLCYEEIDLFVVALV